MPFLSPVVLLGPSPASEIRAFYHAYSVAEQRADLKALDRIMAPNAYYMGADAKRYPARAGFRGLKAYMADVTASTVERVPASIRAAADQAVVQVVIRGAMKRRSPGGSITLNASGTSTDHLVRLNGAWRLDFSVTKTGIILRPVRPLKTKG